MDDPQIREAAGEELVAGSDLLATSLDFADRDAIPPWLMQTGVACGGLCLGAFEGPRIVGVSFAIAAHGSSWFSCGLAVVPGRRGTGIGRRLKLAQREYALRRRIERIRWTAEPLSAGALALYLSGLGATLCAYEPELYATVRPAAVAPDDVLIDWPLDASPRPSRNATERIEIPFAHRELAAEELAPWRARVRTQMCQALDGGLVGTGVSIDRGARRAWVVFQAGQPG